MTVIDRWLAAPRRPRRRFSRSKAFHSTRTGSARAVGIGVVGRVGSLTVAGRCRPPGSGLRTDRDARNDLGQLGPQLVQACTVVGGNPVTALGPGAAPLTCSFAAGPWSPLRLRARIRHNGPAPQSDPSPSLLAVTASTGPLRSSAARSKRSARSGRPSATCERILTMDARVVHVAMRHLTYPHNRAGQRRCRGLGRGAT